MVATPNTAVRLLANVPFSIRQTHVRDFRTKTEQETFLYAKTKHIIDNYTYQREERAIKVHINIDDLHDINYLMYRNGDYTHKWFCAFVTRKEYVNPNTTALFFEIDVYQTWKFDFELLPSYVIREHCNRWNTDGTPRTFTLDEGLNVGEHYETVSIEKYVPFGDVHFLVIVTKSAMHSGSENKITPNVNGHPQPLNYYIHPFKMDGTKPTVNIGGTTVHLSEPLEVLQGIFTQEGAVNNVVSVYITEYFDNLAFTDGVLSLANTDFERVDVVDNQNLTFSTVHVTNLRWYRSKLVDFGDKYSGFTTMSESKMYMYPYAVTVLDDMKGNRIELKNEYINSKNLQIRVKGSLGIFNKVSYQPENYLVSDTVLGDQTIGQEFALINNNPNDIPILAELLSAYFQGNRNTLETTRSQMAWSSLQSIFTGAVGGAVAMGGRGGVVGAIGGGGVGAVNSYFQIESLNAKERDIINTPPSISRMGGNTAFDYGNQLSGVYIIKKQITKEHRDRIGQFFKMFGYKINELKVPNTRTRSHFNYIHTADIQIKGSFPEDDKERLKEIFNSGVTLWHTDDMGNYAVDNSEVA